MKLLEVIRIPETSEETYKSVHFFLFFILVLFCFTCGIFY